MTNRDVTNWTRADDAMVENAIRRGASRRELLRMFMLGGIAMAAGGTILGRAGAALAQTPVTGGHLRAASWSSSTADTLDPAIGSGATDYVRACAYYNRLTTLDEHGQVVMELADAVESDDAKVWTVTLKSGVTFHDGKTLTADDVVYSMMRHKDTATGSKVAAMAEQIEEVRAENPTTVRITLAAPNADLPTILALHHFMIVALSLIHISEPTRQEAISYAVFCLKKKNLIHISEPTRRTPISYPVFSWKKKKKKKNKKKSIL